MAGGRRRAPSRLASALFVTGCLGVLGVTFMLGVMAGRFWPRPPSTPGPVAARDAGAGRGGDRGARPAEPAPPLTFYQDLTAPLTAPPPVKPAKPGRVEKSEKAEKVEPAPKTERPSLPEPSAAPSASAPPAAPAPPSSAGAFTIQVAAYKAREPAEAMRKKLSAAGHDAYVAEIDAAGSARYRVRIGVFATREAARLAADKIVAGERTLSAFVTAR